MNYLYFSDALGGHMLTLRSGDRWCLGCDYDKSGNAYIYLLLGDNDCPICNSREFTRNHPGLRAKSVSKYYAAVIKAIFSHLKDQADIFVDIDEIRKDVLADFWPAWVAAGYVTGDIPL